MRKIFVVANWKMHLNPHEASLLVHRLHERVVAHRDIEVVLGPSMLTLQAVGVAIDRRRFKLAAQNAYQRDDGSFTGEVSFTMLRHVVEYCIIGHSERRIHFGETLEDVAAKVAAAVRNEIVPIVCVGETKEERDSGETKQVLADQVSTALAGVVSSEISSMVIAYEPVWAIGSGEPAKPAAVAEAVAFIRMNVAELYGQAAAKNLHVLYGGSVEPEFVQSLLAIDGVDGFLVGGASLNYEAFAGIIDMAYRYTHKAEHGAKTEANQ